MKLLLIDGSNLIFRAYFATEKQHMLSPKGEDVNAIHNLISMIKKLITDHKPTHIFIALDGKKETFRHKMYEDYKAGRSQTPERLRTQFGLAIDLYNSMGIKNFSMDEYEADDIIATYANIAKKQGIDVQIVSGDKDLLQLIDESVSVLTPKMGFSKEINYTPEIFKEKYDFEPNRFIEYKALVGDLSDNIIGVKKLGDKTARKLILEYKNTDEIVEAAKEKIIKNKIGENIVESEEQIKQNLKLVTLIEDIELDVEIDELKFSDYNYKLFLPFLKNCGFNSIYNQFSKNTNVIERKKVKYQTIENFNMKDHITEENYIFTYTMEDNYHYAKKLGIGICNEKGSFYLSNENMNEEFLNFLNSDIKKITYNLKRLMVVANVTAVKGFIFDVFLASSLISSDNYKKTFDNLAIEYGINEILNYEEVFTSRTKPILPKEEIYIEDIISKTNALKGMYIPLINKLETLKLDKVFHQIELPLTIVLAKMELKGILIDQEQLEKLKDYYENLCNQKLVEINKVTDININSSMQLSNFLFVENELPTKGIKKTLKNYSTDVDNLNKLKNMLIIDPITNEKFIKLIDLIFEYRIYSKLHSTYLLGIEKFIMNGRIHPIYNQLLTETGRLSVMEPNIQNIPIRTEEGKIIRSLFNCNVEDTFVAIDYSQVELRLISNMAKEENMLNDFKNNLDIHSETAKKIFETDECDDLLRSRAKAINFGIIYGMSEYGLSKQVNITNVEAREFIKKYFLNYPKIEGFMQEQIEFAKENGYVKTLFGRRRYIRNINSNNKKDRENSERMAINTPIQGTAADVIKIAMIKIDKYITENNLDIDLIMQIHDELVFYIKTDKVNEYKTILQELMQEIDGVSIKLRADIGMGKNWLESK